ncbi:hypothetical protein BV898_00657 [Hypsibius exemplaris]|uniref:Uncharacterized protein n=1 Tax=Hypsibius exemplaris TaxID=2072580 RepID=A0A1W0XE38_HYPEX|nr:hypothetical protein BV898_00657 [Hypsibius exemplaris]
MALYRILKGESSMPEYLRKLIAFEDYERTLRKKRIAAKSETTLGNTKFCLRLKSLYLLDIPEEKVPCGHLLGLPVDSSQFTTYWTERVKPVYTRPTKVVEVVDLEVVDLEVVVKVELVDVDVELEVVVVEDLSIYAALLSADSTHS